jgi:hypothetical protein
MVGKVLPPVPRWTGLHRGQTCRTYPESDGLKVLVFYLAKCTNVPAPLVTPPQLLLCPAHTSTTVPCRCPSFAMTDDFGSWHESPTCSGQTWSQPRSRASPNTKAAHRPECTDSMGETIERLPTSPRLRWDMPRTGREANAMVCIRARAIARGVRDKQ